MKSFLTYFTTCLLLLVCYLEKQSIQQKDNLELVASPRFFVGRFAGNGGVSKIPLFRMRLNITDSSVKGSYRPADSKIDIDLIGAVNKQNEMVLIESANGKAGGKFRGTIESKNSHLMRLSGYWTNVNGGNLCNFSVEEVIQ